MTEGVHFFYLVYNPYALAKPFELYPLPQLIFFKDRIFNLGDIAEFSTGKHRRLNIFWFYPIIHCNL